MEPVGVVIPTYNEVEAIGRVIQELPPVGDIVVADGGSTDGTQDAARHAGARVIDAGRGYGRACHSGAEAVRDDCRVIVFLDGDGADRGDLLARIADPVLAGTHDFVLASRTRGDRDPGSMLWHQVLAGRVAGWGMGALYGMRYSDMCVSRDRPRPRATQHARNDLWLEHRDADEGRSPAAAHYRGADAIPVPDGWTFEGRGIVSRNAARQQDDRFGLSAGGHTVIVVRLRGYCINRVKASPETTKRRSTK